MINLYEEIIKRNVVDRRLIYESDIFSEKQFNDDEYMESLIISDKYSLEEVREFFINKAPYIVINVYNDGEDIGKCTLAEHFYCNQFNIEIDDEIMEIERTGRYEITEFHSGVWVYEVVR